MPSIISVKNNRRDFEEYMNISHLCKLSLFIIFILCKDASANNELDYFRSWINNLPCHKVNGTTLFESEIFKNRFCKVNKYICQKFYDSLEEEGKQLTSDVSEHDGVVVAELDRLVGNSFQATFFIDTNNNTFNFCWKYYAYKDPKNTDAAALYFENKLRKSGTYPGCSFEDYKEILSGEYDVKVDALCGTWISSGDIKNNGNVIKYNSRVSINKDSNFIKNSTLKIQIDHNDKIFGNGVFASNNKKERIFSYSGLGFYDTDSIQAELKDTINSAYASKDFHVNFSIKDGCLVSDVGENRFVYHKSK